MEDFSYCQVGGVSDTGRVRKANEDNWAAFESINGYVIVVCDGMGGQVAGATASSTAVNAIKRYLCRQYISSPKIALENAVKVANEAIINAAAKDSTLKGMGTTCALLLVRDELAYIAHVGDSRIYLIRNHEIKQLTKDHSYVQKLIDAGKITEVEAESHPKKNVITNALGFKDLGKPTIAPAAIHLKVRDRILLCTDGLWRMMSANDMEDIISKSNITVDERAQQLIDAANDNGGKDNITGAIIQFVDNETQDTTMLEVPEMPSTPHTRRVKIIVTLLSLIALIAIIFIGYKCTDSSRDRVDTPQVAITDTLPKDDGKDTLNLMSVSFEKNAPIITLDFANSNTLNIKYTSDRKSIIAPVTGYFVCSFSKVAVDEYPDLAIEKQGNIMTIKFKDTFNDPSLAVTLTTTDNKSLQINIPIDHNAPRAEAPRDTTTTTVAAQTADSKDI